jgi:hypothetical protein
VRHRNPFEDLEVPRNEFELSIEFIEQWVTPFYLDNLSILNTAAIASFVVATKKIDQTIVAKLLGDSNWRSRRAGALFSAIMNYKEFESIIGRSLLKSEVCYAGSAYCIALATFATGSSRDFLIA